MSVLIRFILSIFIGLSLSFSQSHENALGIGFPVQNHDAATAGVFPVNLLPTFQEGVSISNPSTWIQLNNTLLTGTFGGKQEEIQSGSLINQNTFLQQFQFIVPVKNKYAFGLSITPDVNRYYSLFDDDNSIPDSIFDDTLSVRKSVLGSGGVASFTSSIVFPITSSETMALSLNYLFGSSRDYRTITIKGRDFIQKNNDIYSGLYLKLFVHSKRLTLRQKIVDLFISIQTVLKPLSINRTQHQPFEDITGTGIHESYDIYGDFPLTNLTPASILVDSLGESKPLEIQIGFDWEIKSRLHIQSGWSHWNDQIKDIFSASVINNQVLSLDKVGIGFILFSKKYPRKILEHFHYRCGAFLKDIKLVQSNKKIDEIGVSFGFGFKFGVMENQIDVGFSISKRTGFLVGDELLKQFSVGLSLGDIWFIKRRER